MKRENIIASSIILIAVIIYIKGCVYLPISGTVVDAETKQPLEGAVVLAEWTITKGFGLTYTESYKVFETITDKDGRFKIKTYILNPFVNKPHLTIYKKGYVCWNNEVIFPGSRNREGFRWKSRGKYELERFRKEYSYKDHVGFIGHFVPVPPFMDATHPFERAYEWERIMSQIESRDKK